METTQHYDCWHVDFAAVLTELDWVVKHELSSDDKVINYTIRWSPTKDQYHGALIWRRESIDVLED